MITEEDRLEKERLRLRIYRLEHPDKVRSSKKKYNDKNKDSIKLFNGSYYQSNKDSISDQKAEYYKENREKLISYQIKYITNRLKTDQNFRLAWKLRNRLRMALKSQKVDKSERTMDLVGCCLESLKTHMSKQFRTGMTWENNTLKGWHIDHIKPMSSFDLSDPEEQKKCNNYTNLQPLWWWENLEKGDKINIEKIRIDGDTQSRESLKEATILDYTEKVLAGEIFKPIKIIYDGKDWWLADGFHRYFAHKRAKVNTIDADISNGTKRDAWIYSLSANGKHGLPRSNEDKRRSVMRALNDIELCDKTNIEIAKICDVSDMTVGRIRKELELLKEAKKKPKTKPVEPPKEEYIQDEVHELRTENQALLTENTKLRDQMAIGVLEIDDEEKITIQETVESLRAEVSRLQSLLDAMTISRNDFQQKAADAINQIKYWKRRAEKSK